MVLCGNLAMDNYLCCKASFFYFFPFPTCTEVKYNNLSLMWAMGFVLDALGLEQCVLFYNITCYINSLLSRIHVNPIYFLNKAFYLPQAWYYRG